MLGTGLGGLVDEINERVSIDYADIPFLPIPSVKGHGKRLSKGVIDGKRVICWEGRIHMYEGYQSHELNFITYLSAFLGCKYMILTNSSGGGVKGMKAGSIMVSSDHFAWASKCPVSPVVNDPRFGSKYVNASRSGHSPYLLGLAHKAAE